MRGVLLTASDATRVARLTRREIGTDLDRHLASTRRMATMLDELAPDWIARMPTDDSTVAEVAAAVIGLSGWPPDRKLRHPLDAGPDARPQER
jgi:hypothetical protein